MSEELIDKAAFETLKSMTDPGFLVELIDVFLCDTPDQIEQMRAGIEQDNLEQVRRAAHSVKSNSASFGAARLTGACRELEMLAKSGTLEGAGSKLEQITAEYQKLIPFLQELKNEC